MAIRFFLHHVDFNFRGKRKIKALIKKIFFDHKKTNGGINIILTCDNDLLAINKKFLKRKYYTDIITFNYSKENKIIGELYISIDRVKENAGIYNVTIENELLRIIVHGILHLLGYDDGSEKERKRMRKSEDIYLKMY